MSWPGVPVGQLLQLFRVIQCRPWIVDRARPGDDDEPGIAPGQRLGHCCPGIRNHVRRTFADRDLFQQDGWRNERADLGDAEVVCRVEASLSRLPHGEARTESADFESAEIA